MQEILDEHTLKISILSLHEWLTKNDMKGYEPFDGLTSKLKFLTFNKIFYKLYGTNLMVSVGFKSLSSPGV